MSNAWRDKVIAAREVHDVSLISSPSGYGWGCPCGARRSNLPDSSIDFLNAAREASEHEADAIVAALDLPNLQEAIDAYHEAWKQASDATLSEVDRLRALIRGKDLEIAALRRERDVWREDSSPTVEGNPAVLRDWDDRHQYDDAG